MPSDENKASRAPGMPTILTDEGQLAWNVFGTHPEQAVLLLPGDGTLLAPGLLEPPTTDDDRLQVLKDLGERTRATVLLTAHPVRQLDHIPTGVHVMGRSGWVHHHNGADHTECGPVLRELQSFGVRLADTLRWLELAATVEVRHSSVLVRLARLEEEDRSKLLDHVQWLATADGLIVLADREDVDVEVGPGPNKLNILREFIPNQWSMPSAVLAVADCEEDLEVFDHLDWLRTTMEAHVIKVCASDHPGLRERADVIVRGPKELLGLLRKLRTGMTR